MKQTDETVLKEARILLKELKELRGGSILDNHKRMANDPKLLKAFLDQYKNNNTGESAIPPKYKELLVMGMGAACGMENTVRVHGSRAVDLGATAEEIGEVFRCVFMLTGVKGISMIGGIFDMIDE